MLLYVSIGSLREVLLRTMLAALVCSSVFDPADLILHLKVPLFIACWCLFAAGAVVDNNRRFVDSFTLLYVLSLSIVLPAISISRYLLEGGDSSVFDGFVAWKSFLFLTLALMLVAERIDLFSFSAGVLTILSISIIAVRTLIYLKPTLAIPIGVLGDKYGILTLLARDYGAISFSGVNFHTSPLIVLALGYFAFRLSVTAGWYRLIAAFLLVINVFGMFASGTRNNMLFSLLTPILAYSWYSRRRIPILLGAASVTLLVAFLNFNSIGAALDLREYSNHIKYLHYQDYLDIFSRPASLILGSGVGSRFYSRGFGTYTSVTELTYFELLRSFGLCLGSLILLLLLLPLRCLLFPKQKAIPALLIAYGAYLLLSAANPFLISSSGMFVLSIVLAATQMGPSHVIPSAHE